MKKQHFFQTLMKYRWLKRISYHPFSKSRSLSTTCAESRQSGRKCIVFSAGNGIPYKTAWKWQEDLMKERFRDSSLPDAVIFLQHESVYTIGRGGSLDNVKFDPSNSPEMSLIRVDRGGEVTYHGPGQLVVYPILNLRFHRKDLHWYLRSIEQVVINTLKAFDIPGERIDGLTGVWANGKKLAAVGTHASKWITMHGFGLNVNTDLKAFENIIPCGIKDREVGTMAEFIPGIRMEEVEAVALASLAKVFDFYTLKVPMQQLSPKIIC